MEWNLKASDWMRRSRNGFYLTSANVNELAQAMVTRIMDRPDIAAWHNVNPHSPEEWQTWYQWHELKTLLDQLVVSVPEAFKLYAWLTREYLKGQFGGRMAGTDDVLSRDEQQQIISNMRHLQAHLQYTRTNRDARTPDMNGLTYQEAMAWTANQEAAGVKVDTSVKWDADEAAVYRWPDGWTIVQLLSAEDLKQEGEIMGHCVGGYANQVRERHCHIFSLHDPRGGPHVTIEVVGAPDRDFGTGNEGWSVVQIKGAANNAPKEEYKERVRQWFGHLRDEAGVQIGYGESKWIEDTEDLIRWYYDQDGDGDDNDDDLESYDLGPMNTHPRCESLDNLATACVEEAKDGGADTNLASAFRDLCYALDYRVSDTGIAYQAEDARDTYIDNEMESRMDSWDSEYSVEYYVDEAQELVDKEDYQEESEDEDEEGAFNEEGYDTAVWEVAERLHTEAREEYERDLRDEIAYDIPEVLDELSSLSSVRVSASGDTHDPTHDWNSMDTWRELQGWINHEVATCLANGGAANQVLIEMVEMLVGEGLETHLADTLVMQAIHSIRGEQFGRGHSDDQTTQGIEQTQWQPLPPEVQRQLPRAPLYGSLRLSQQLGISLSALHDFELREVGGDEVVLDINGDETTANQDIKGGSRSINAYYAGHIVGSLMFTPEEDSTWISSLYVAPEYRKSNLMLSMLQPLLDRGVPLEGFCWDERMRALLERHRQRFDREPAWTERESSWLIEAEGFVKVAANVHDLAQTERTRLQRKFQAEFPEYEDSEQYDDLFGLLDELPNEGYKLFKYIYRWIKDGIRYGHPAPYYGEEEQSAGVDTLRAGIHYLTALKTANKAWPELNRMSWNDFLLWVMEQQMLAEGRRSLWAREKRVLEFPDGWYFAELGSSQADLRQESDMMGNCVGSYYNDIGERMQIYSLRDPKGVPHCDVQLNYHNTHGYWWPGQIYGQANRPPKPAYQEKVKELFAQLNDSGQGVDNRSGARRQSPLPEHQLHFEIKSAESLDAAITSWFQHPERFGQERVPLGQMEDPYGLMINYYAPAPTANVDLPELVAQVCRLLVSTRPDYHAAFVWGQRLLWLAYYASYHYYPTWGRFQGNEIIDHVDEARHRYQHVPELEAVLDYLERILMASMNDVLHGGLSPQQIMAFTMYSFGTQYGVPLERGTEVSDSTDKPKNQPTAPPSQAEWNAGGNVGLVPRDDDNPFFPENVGGWKLASALSNCNWITNEAYNWIANDDQAYDACLQAAQRFMRGDLNQAFFVTSLMHWFESAHSRAGGYEYDPNEDPDEDVSQIEWYLIAQAFVEEAEEHSQYNDNSATDFTLKDIGIPPGSEEYYRSAPPDSVWDVHSGVMLIEASVEESAAIARERARARLEPLAQNFDAESGLIHPLGLLAVLAQLPNESWKMFEWLAIQYQRGNLQKWAQEFRAQITDMPEIDSMENLRGAILGQVLLFMQKGGALLEAARRGNHAPDLLAMRWADFITWYQDEQGRLQAQSDRWNERIPVHSFPNGWTIEKVRTEEDLNLEGEMMGNCAGQKAPLVLQDMAQMYSLRDQRGVPHATIYFEGGQLNQIRGRGNTPPTTEYVQMVTEWLAQRRLDPSALTQALQPDHVIGDGLEPNREPLAHTQSH